MNKRQIKVELLFASDELLQQTYDKTLEKPQRKPLGDFIGIIADAVEQSIKFYGRHVERDPNLGEPMCNSLKVTLEHQRLSVKYLVDMPVMLEILDAGPMMLFFGEFDFNPFMKKLNALTSDFYQTSFTVDEIDETVEFETQFDLDKLLDYAKKLPEPQKLF